MTCDFCGSPDVTKTYSAATVSSAAAKGFRPPPRREVPGSVLSASQAEKAWLDQVAGDTTSRAACRPCSDRLDRALEPAARATKEFEVTIVLSTDGGSRYTADSLEKAASWVLSRSTERLEDIEGSDVHIESVTYDISLEGGVVYTLRITCPSSARWLAFGSRAGQVFNGYWDQIGGKD